MAVNDRRRCGPEERLEEAVGSAQAMGEDGLGNGDDLSQPVLVAGVVVDGKSSMATVGDMCGPASPTDRLPAAGAQPREIKRRMTKAATTGGLEVVAPPLQILLEPEAKLPEAAAMFDETRKFKAFEKFPTRKSLAPGFDGSQAASAHRPIEGAKSGRTYRAQAADSVAEQTASPASEIRRRDVYAAEGQSNGLVVIRMLGRNLPVVRSSVGEAILL